MTKSTIELTQDSRGVLFVCLNRPEVRNAFNERMIEELSEVFSTRAKSPDVRVVVLRGQGSVFCAGGDLNWMKKSVEVSVQENFKDTQRLTQMFKTIQECPKPVVGVVHKAAIGGGVGLVSVCDWVLASAQTEFSLSEVRLGIVPACIGPFVISKIGASQARALFITAQRFLAQRAYEIGLVHQVIPEEDQLDSALEMLLKTMLQCGPQAIEVAKKLVLDLSWPERRAEITDCYDYVAQVLADLRVTPEAQEGVRAFLEKRKPRWLA
ncbi:MAG: enoyl-CoA hydratase-related protein [Bdellovibrionia bacterium]